VDDLLLEVVAWAGAAAVVVGGVLAFVQTDLRRLLAYSSIGQMGVVALGAGLSNPTALTGAVMHIANDALMKGALFLVAGMALVRFGVRRVDDLSRLRGRAPWAMAVIVVAGLSLVGIPPLSGFFGKWYVLSGAVEDARWAFVVALAVGSLASVGYVFRIFEPLFFRPAVEDAPVREGNAVMLIAALLVLALGLVVLGIGNERLVTVFIAPPCLGAAMTGIEPAVLIAVAVGAPFTAALLILVTAPRASEAWGHVAAVITAAAAVACWRPGVGRRDGGAGPGAAGARPGPAAPGRRARPGVRPPGLPALGGHGVYSGGYARATALGTGPATSPPSPRPSARPWAWPSRATCSRSSCSTRR
jgi:NADH:ubiquinone oxidoreductase subunit 5 (subunit L)/multisubunit Na+/H+ antiporter MnhA subunit